MTDEIITPTRRGLLTAAAGIGAGLVASAALADPTAPVAADDAPMVMEEPTVTVGLEHVFDIRIDFGTRRLSAALPWGGVQGYTPVGPRGGLVRGPRLNGKVVESSGADFAQVRADGIVEFNAHYLLEADDGTMIYIQNHGYGGAGSFRIAPTFRVPKGPHDWLTRTIIVGSGEPRRKPVDHSIFRYYAVT